MKTSDFVLFRVFPAIIGNFLGFLALVWLKQEYAGMGSNSAVTDSVFAPVMSFLTFMIFYIWKDYYGKPKQSPN